MNRDFELSHDNPTYSAGFVEGRKFERELQEEQQQKNKTSVTVKATELDIFKDLAELMRDFAEYVEQQQTEESKKLIDSLDSFNQKMAALNAKNIEKLESEGMTIQRL